MSSALLWNSNNPQKEKQFQKEEIHYSWANSLHDPWKKIVVFGQLFLSHHSLQRSTQTPVSRAWGVSGVLATALLLEFHMLYWRPQSQNAPLVSGGGTAGAQKERANPFPPSHQPLRWLEWWPFILSLAIPRLKQVFVGLAALSGSLHAPNASWNYLDDTIWDTHGDPWLGTLFSAKKLASEGEESWAAAGMGRGRGQKMSPWWKKSSLTPAQRNKSWTNHQPNHQCWSFATSGVPKSGWSPKSFEGI